MPRSASLSLAVAFGVVMVLLSAAPADAPPIERLRSIAAQPVAIERVDPIQPTRTAVPIPDLIERTDPLTPKPLAPSLPAPVESLASDLASLLDDGRLGGLDVSVSLWHEDHGVVFTRNPHLKLYPASNQKLLTAVGALALLPADFTFETEVAYDASSGDLILVAGGDPTLTMNDLERMANGVAARLTAVPGDLVVVADRFAPARMAPGWLDWQMPQYVGPLSTFIVGDNRHRLDSDYLSDPDLGNAELLLTALTAAGVTIGGEIRHGARPSEAEPLVVLESSTRDELVDKLLARSDNEVAEALVREIGYRERGEGSHLAGLEAIHDHLTVMMPGLEGESGDGSGLSRANLRSAGEWQRLLLAAAEAEWGSIFFDSLAVSGVRGTLSRRLAGSDTAGKIHAKTGSIIGGRSLSGYVSNTVGDRLVFSIVVNGKGAGASLAVIDDFAELLASSG